MKSFSFVVFFLVLSSISMPIAKAETDQFISIVNPIRISFYTKDVSESVSTQYAIIKTHNLPATWLLTYDALTHEKLQKVLQSMDQNQEFGIFLEITPNFADAAEVTYNETGSWHHATSVFLSGYTQEDRRKFIDTVFDKFKNTFGYYPTSVGSWWTDAYALNYMKEKYDITANLGVSDQFSTDGYQIWGTYWSTPYYPSRIHAGIPGINDSRLDIVTTQWAHRHPYEGYFSSLYSTQDYKVAANQQPTKFFEDLVKLYGGQHNNNFGHITVGLEGDFNPADYAGEFTKQMKIVLDLSRSEEFEVLTMKDFSEWYKVRFPEKSPVQVIASDSLLDSDIKVWWYQSPYYRVGIRYNSESKQLTIFDLRIYFSNFKEPYFQIPNKDFILSSYIPSIFDEVSHKENIWTIPALELKGVFNTDESLTFTFSNGYMSFSTSGVSMRGIDGIPPKVISTSYQPEMHNKDITSMQFNTGFVFDENGYTFKTLTEGAKRHLVRKRNLAVALILVISIIILFIRIKVTFKKKITLLILFCLGITLSYSYWFQGNSSNYFVSQSEVDALNYLYTLPKGAVLIYDKECLGCEYHSTFKPAVFANERGYVSRFAKKKSTANQKIFEATDKEEAKRVFSQLDVEYIYLASYEGYKEKIPFSPGDLEIEKIYANAHSEIWRRNY